MELLQYRNASTGNDPSPYYLPTAGATDVVRFDAQEGSTSFNSLVQSSAFVPESVYGNIWQFQQSGPLGLVGAKASFNGSADATYNASYKTAMSTAYNIAAGDNFTIMWQFKFPSTHPGAGLVPWDYGCNAGTAAGFYLELSSTYIRLQVYDDGAQAHGSQFNGSGGLGWKDDTFYTFRWVFNRANTKANLYIKEEGQVEVDYTSSVTASATAFSSMGALTVATRNLCFQGYGNGSVNTNGTGAISYQWAIAKNTTYDASFKP